MELGNINTPTTSNVNKYNNSGINAYHQQNWLEQNTDVYKIPRDILTLMNNLKYLIVDDTLKKEETLDLLEFRNKLINKLKTFK